MLICIECTLVAVRDGTALPKFDETPEEHMRRVHPGGGLQGKDRAKLEQDAADALNRRAVKADTN